MDKDSKNSWELRVESWKLSTKNWYLTTLKNYFNYEFLIFIELFRIFVADIGVLHKLKTEKVKTEN